MSSREWCDSFLPFIPSLFGTEAGFVPLDSCECVTLDHGLAGGETISMAEIQSGTKTNAHPLKMVIITGC